jgi:manganese transport protein
MIAMFLQYLSIKCGIATNRDLAQACRDSYPPKLVAFLWIVMEVAIAATDLAEVIGSAVALKLLFNLPLIAGVCITACDVLLLMLIGQGSNRFRILEAFVGVLVLLITACFAAEVGLSKPEAIPLLAGFIPDTSLFENSSKLFIAAGIIGATVMPHNIFLHSSIVLTRNTHRDEESMTKAIRYSTIDCNVSLSVAWFVNSAILIVAASAFHAHGYKSVATLEEASSLLNPILGSKAASILFGVALLGSGQNSTLSGRSISTLNTGVRLICRIIIFVGTLSGQIVMEGFLNWKIRPVYRRLITRLVAIVPAVIAILVGGDKSTNDLLIISQVVLCFALPFAIFPLVHITSNRSRMGKFANTLFTSFCAYVIGTVLIVLNIFVSVS